MTVKECYSAHEGDYESVISRLMTEKLVQKFIVKFLSDPSYENLTNAMRSENYDEAFREAHTLKGVCQNLSFTKLYSSSSSVTEALRNGEYSEAEKLMPLLEADYIQTIAAINSID